VKRLFTLLLGIAIAAHGLAREPFLAETKVQNDLESLLSRLIVKEQFLVQVNAEITTRTERRLVEGETSSQSLKTEPEIQVQAMPGFVPEAHEDPRPPEAQQQRQIYRLVDVPEVKSIRVQASFDEALDQPTVVRAKMLIQSYLTTNYPNVGSFSFTQLPMLKPPKPPEPPPKEELEKAKEKKPEVPPELTWQEKLWNERVLILLGAIFTALLLMSRRPAPTPAESRPRRTARRNPLARFAHMPPLPGMMAPHTGLPSMTNADASAARTRASLTEEVLAFTRKKLLDRFFMRSDAFRGYYQTLSKEARNDLYSVVQGPAFDSFLDGLHTERPAGPIPEPADPEALLEEHSRSFEEFIHAKDWQNRQLFGFLHNLSEEQILSLVSHESPLASCLMLRFMKAEQTARVLDALPEGRRVDILGHLPELETTSFSKISIIEKEVRSVVQAMPEQALGVKKEEIDYWGTVVSESNSQDALLQDLQRTQPDIFADLKKFKFSLEDASTLPDNLLDKVLSGVDNEELALALATCREDVVTVFLDAVSDKRRDLLSHYVNSARNAPKEQTQAARQALSRKFREVLA